jgi:hypothetical protein
MTDKKWYDDLPAPIDWPPGRKEAKRPDTRMVRCVLGVSYTSCPSVVIDGCICATYPREVYEQRYKERYGDDG